MGAQVRALAQGDLVAAAEAPVRRVIPVYVINLARSPERRAFMAQVCAKAGVEPNFVAAVDGRACRSQRNPRAALSRGETALILSHRKVWRRLLASEAPYAVVLEDDAHLGEGFAALLEADWRILNFDAVKLETMYDKVWLERRGRTVAGRALRRLGAEHLGSAGYLVSRAGAAKLLKLTRPLREPIDQTLFGRRAIFEGEVTAYQLDPAVVVQDRLAPHTAAAAPEMGTTLQEADRLQITEAMRRRKPRGWRRLAREALRLWEQARRAARLWPGMTRRRPLWR